MNFEKWANEHMIHKIIAGSQLYGTSTPESDVDIRGVCLMPLQALLGLQNFEQYQLLNEEQDVEIYGLTKFVRLALDANPNILDILFAPKDRWMMQTEEWQQIYDNRKLFLSTRVRHTFSGYAHSQLKRLQTHREWLMHPSDHRPTPEEYNCKLVTDSKGGQTVEAVDPQDKRKYGASCLRWEQYQNWLKNRNPERAKLEKQFGYDTKHACHLVRLLLKAKFILEVGDYNPALSEADRVTVLGVKEGNWTYECLIDWAQHSDEEVQNMLSDLPHSPNRKVIEEILIMINLKTISEAKW